MLCPR